MSMKDYLNNIVAGKAPGPKPSFSVLDILKTLELIAKAGSMGRGKIAERTGLGGGAVRTLINRLTEAELIASSKEGCVLTDKGKDMWVEIKSVIFQKHELKQDELLHAPCNVAILVKNRGTLIGKGLEQRDAAVMAGGKGALTLVFKRGKLVLPSISSDMARNYPKTFKHLDDVMKIEEDDVIIISGADTLREAEYGALAAAWTLF